MSSTELHFGRFEVVARGEENIHKFIKENDVKVEDDYIEDDNYEIIKKYNRKEKIYEDPILIHFLEHKYFNEEDYPEEFIKNEDGTYSFVVEFYNGGCCLAEALENFENDCS